MKPTTFSSEAFPFLHSKGKRAKGLKNATNLASNIRKTKRDALRLEYLALVECAPRRADAGKDYFVGHEGIPSSGRCADTSSEEILAMALWNEKKTWTRYDGDEFRLLDYQFPLSAWDSDEGVGAIDLLGVSSQGRLIVIELKVKPCSPAARGDSPAKTMLQGLRYAAIVQSNQEAIAVEIEEKFGLSVCEEAPVVQILALEDWWQDWTVLKGSTYNKVGNWAMAFKKLAKDVEELIGVAIECASLNVKKGEVTIREDSRPILNRTPELRIIDPSVRRSQ